MKAAIVVKWTTPVPGREKAAVAYGREVDDFYGKKAADGLCTEPKWFWAPTGESLWFVEGAYESLLASPFHDLGSSGHSIFGNG